MAKLTQKQVAAIKLRKGVPKSTHVQSVLVKKMSGMSVSDAVARVKKAGFVAPKVDETKNYYRFRQRPPSYFNKKSFRTKEIKPGLKIITGRPK